MDVVFVSLHSVQLYDVGVLEEALYLDFSQELYFAMFAQAGFGDGLDEAE